MQTKDEQKYPKSVIFIIGNEFCERFSYYGMRTILTLFLTTILLYDDNTATVIYHGFSMACYFTPIFGALLADILWGKFRTIFYISILYAAGNIVISLSSVPNLLPMRPIALLGLVMIAFGTGGIKPCVSAFGGDQFEPNQEKQLQRFFSLFYLSINAGSLISTFLTPVLRADVQCFGDTTCFPLAFGVPAILMIVALILFLLGRPLYKINPPSGNVIVDVTRCISHALFQKGKSKKAGVIKEHWLDYAEEKYDAKLIANVKALLRVLFLYLPLPLFWALFDQQGSRWTLQATKMNGSFLGYVLKPDQIQVINPLLIIGFIPLFEYIIYPLLAKCHLLVRPLQRITFGGLLAAFSFVVAGFIQISLESTLPVHPAEGYSQLTIINQMPCTLNIQGSVSTTDLQPNLKITANEVKSNIVHKLELIPKDCTLDIKPLIYNFQTNSTSVETIILTNYENNIHLSRIGGSLEKPETGDSKVGIVYNLGNNDTQNVTFRLQGDDNTYNLYSVGNIGSILYIDVAPGKYKLTVRSNDAFEQTLNNSELLFESGGNYLCVVTADGEELKVSHHVMVEPNHLSMLLQVPQYVIITAGEIMFSITGLEFSYSQAPKSMKSVVQAAWLLTTAFGNLIVMIIAELKLFEKQSYEFFMFACLMVLDMLVFAIMAYYYKYVNEEQAKNGFIDEQINEKNDDKCKTNEGFQEDTQM